MPAPAHRYAVLRLSALVTSHHRVNVTLNGWNPATRFQSHCMIEMEPVPRGQGGIEAASNDAVSPTPRSDAVPILPPHSCNRLFCTRSASTFEVCLCHTIPEQQASLFTASQHSLGSQCVGRFMPISSRFHMLTSNREPKPQRSRPVSC